MQQESLESLWGLDNKFLAKAEKIEKKLEHTFKEIHNNSFYNQAKVLKAFKDNKIAENSFSSSSGYGYNDIGREQLEKVYAEVFSGESALVRPQLITGTHALSCCLLGILRPQEELLSVTGLPYSTLLKVIGLKSRVPGSLKDYNVDFNHINLIEDIINRNSGNIKNKLTKNINSRTKMVLIQRSKGYTTRPSLTVEDINYISKIIKSLAKGIFILIDNCYGEFVEKSEPILENKVMLVGSLIKNPGGGLAPLGGYVISDANTIEKVASRMTAPGLGTEIGPSLDLNKSFFQGFFLAPHFVGEALKGAIFAAALFADIGYKVFPQHHEKRGDIVQCISLEDPDKLKEFCLCIQESSPVDSFASPIPGELAGYEEKVIMAAGTFTQGSSLELSADAPFIPPYQVFFQGGLTYEHGKLAILKTAQRLSS